MEGARDEVMLEVDGRQVPLALTLRALAEIEEGLGAATLPELAEKLARPSAGQLLIILKAMAKAGGAKDPEAVAAGGANLKEIMGAVTLLFREVLTGEVPGKRPVAGGDGEAG